MFERGKAIREAKKEELRRKYRAEGRAEARQEVREEVRAEVQKENAERVQALLKTPGVVLPPEVADAIFGDDAKDGS